MKRIVLLLALLIASVPAFAQEQTLFGGTYHSGGFGGPVTKYSSIKGEPAVVGGGYGGWLVNHSFMIGGGFYGLSSNIRAGVAADAAYPQFGTPLYLEFGYGGLMLEYIIAPSQLVHISVQTLVGAGGVTYRTRRFDDEWFDDGGGDNRHIDQNDALFVLEPAVTVELNVTSWMRLGAGASYRYVNGADRLVGIGNSDLGGVSGMVLLKFGSF